MDRNKIIIRTSIIGIIANIFLAGFKAVVGTLTSSIAIVLDSVNNLSDVLSSVITIIGTKLAGKKPDRKHPFGHGRIEYISALLISVIVLYAGITSLVESVKKIVHPKTPEYTAISLIIVAVAVIVKILLGLYVKKTGKSVNSSALVASGTDALMDSIISFSTLAAALIFILFHLSLEAWLGAVISIVIIRSGIEMLRDSLSDIIGQRVDSSISKEVKRTICTFDEVQGAYDLILHSYGPDALIGSVHIEVPDTMTVDKLDKLERKITEKVLAEHSIILAGISVYSQNTGSDKASMIYSDIRRQVMSHEFILQIHGFFLDEETKSLSFDIIVDFAAPDSKAIYNEVCQEIQQAYPDYKVTITLDLDVSD
ncbi:MAG: cation diffusion facilitator family transporter [Ruminococcus sp.]|nr:cation diffusion facilitator family transporter [Ruminococcus sp.]